VVYDFAINPHGTCAELLEGDAALLSAPYYVMQAPGWLRQDARIWTPARRRELERFGAACRTRPEMAGLAGVPFTPPRPAPPGRGGGAGGGGGVAEWWRENGFDREQHERIRAERKRGQIGLAQNRLPPNTAVEDVRPGDCVDALDGLDEHFAKAGREMLARG